MYVSVSVYMYMYIKYCCKTLCSIVQRSENHEILSKYTNEERTNTRNTSSSWCCSGGMFVSSLKHVLRVHVQGWCYSEKLLFQMQELIPTSNVHMECVCVSVEKTLNAMASCQKDISWSRLLMFRGCLGVLELLLT